MNDDKNTLKACIYNTDLVRILEILKMINFTGKCLIKTDDLILILTEDEGLCRDAGAESTDDEIPSEFIGLRDSSLIRKITEINPLARETRLYSRNGSEKENSADAESALLVKTKDIGFMAEETKDSSEYNPKKITYDPDSLFEEELSRLDSASIVKMKEKFRREMEDLAGEILNEKND
ncbi:hypothetical protein [Methanoplanus limicola]|uniref:Uncharacterized protein n=1 Tax=Methanoplanus limicola DSM 2279 TaxID=937775 RepID=H1YX57_9EURY|nr:hypothetical protein [Methanoplanus limicola]EHQ35860.1 hypothetical protein Metlim_1759 [Methanoplanus limicola DSM 2279]